MELYTVKDALGFLKIPFDLELAKSLGVVCSQLSRKQGRKMGKKMEGQYFSNAYEADIIREVFAMHPTTAKAVAIAKAGKG